MGQVVRFTGRSAPKQPEVRFCPTCGGPVEPMVSVYRPQRKTSLGWRIVSMFWSAVVIGIFLLAIFG